MHPAVWFWGQVALLGIAVFIGMNLARRPARIWKPSALLATLFMLIWPFLRWFPTQAMHVFDVELLVFTEITGIVIPASILFAIAAAHARAPGERRAIRLLLVVCCLFFVRNGLWMIRAGVPDLGPTKWQGDVCLQSTDYTCVAAALVTQLRAHGIESSETEMARLSFTEVGNGSTDTRAVYALKCKLADSASGKFDVQYELMDFDRLCRVPKPCVVSVKWSYLISHMVPVMYADSKKVVIGDPLIGPHAETVGEFNKTWHKAGITLQRR